MTVLNNFLEVTQYLKDKGWKVSKSKVYEDKHHIKRQKDGTILASEADKYAQKFCERAGGNTDPELEKTSADILYWQRVEQEERAKKLQFENEIKRGKYVERSAMEQQFAARAVFLRSSLENFFRGRVPDIITLCNGDMAKAPDTIDFCLRELDETLDHYSKPVQFMAPIVNTAEEEDSSEETSSQCTVHGEGLDEHDDKTEEPEEDE